MCMGMNIAKFRRSTTYIQKCFLRREGEITLNSFMEKVGF